ncbi:MAG: hypothetical protein F8N38_22585, partial [Hungatella sp.]|nr:hypothetical protein [Hungatella sp.]
MVGAGLAIVNAGSIAGAAGAPAIRFTGGTNSLTLEAGSAITGAVLASSSADSLILGGGTGAGFDVSQIGSQYQGFGVFQKTGAGTWTLTGTTAAATPWTIAGG